MWLAGDAAHLAGPAGVQSMNLGLTEASELAGIIAAGGAADAFAAYDARWINEWRKLLGVSASLHADPHPDPWIAARASRLLSCLPAHGEELAALAGQVGLALSAKAGA